jgi:Holliday junction DNA helicase RuvA
MIGKLRGLVDEIAEDHVILDVNGVGYHVHGSSHMLANLPGKGEAAMLVIETHVREDHIHLYGFLSNEERAWFRLLTTVQGVGVRMALAIMGLFNPSQLSQTIGAQDSAALTQVSGVGKKLAERIITELKNKVASMPVTGGEKVVSLNTAANAGSSEQEEAVSALVNLGYGRTEAFQAVALAAGKIEEDDLQSLITAGLKELAR